MQAQLRALTAKRTIAPAPRSGSPRDEGYEEPRRPRVSALERFSFVAEAGAGAMDSW